MKVVLMIFSATLAAVWVWHGFQALSDSRYLAAAFAAFMASVNVAVCRYSR